MKLARRHAKIRRGVTCLMDRLVGRGWVVREQPAGNRREVYATLTPAGRAVLTRTRAAFASGLQDTLGHHLDAQDVTELRQATPQAAPKTRRLGSAPLRAPGSRPGARLIADPRAMAPHRPPRNNGITGSSMTTAD